MIVVEDIVDTGLTLHYLQDILRARGPASLRTACLLSKPSRRKIEVPVEYVGFTIEDRFVVGYGLDFNEQLSPASIHRRAHGVTAARTALAAVRASARTAAAFNVRTIRPRINTLPLTMVVSTSSPRVV